MTGLLVPHVIAARARATPDAIAVEHGAERLTYRELDARSSRLAVELRRLDVGVDGIVGVLQDRTLDMVASFLGIWKAGAAYLPLDTKYPFSRLAFMLENSRAQVILTDSTSPVIPGLEGIKRISVDAHGARDVGDAPSDQTPIAPANIAYVIYTSGSSGVPKGVAISHDAIANHMDWMVREFPLTPSDRVLQRTSPSFDASVWEWIAPLMTGGCLVLVSRDAAGDPARLARAITKDKITIMQAVPSLLDVLLQQPQMDGCRSLRRVFSGGEALRIDLAQSVFARLDAELVNLYGPTECTIDATSWICPRDATSTSIGRPITNMQAYVVNEALKLVDRGPGELLLGGAGLARGYLGRPELTAEKFIPDPFGDAPGARLYRTGDLVQWRPDGTLEFLGRIDDQIKLRGFRIELGEIESALRRHPGINEVAVVVREDLGSKRIVAYYVSDGPVADLRDVLKNKLPEHMIPSAFMRMTAMRRLPNGKIDRKALPAPQVESGAAYMAPRTPLEQRLVELWQESLGVPRVGLRDDFFDLGGDSMMALALVYDMGKALDRDLPISVLVENPTIQGVLERLDGGERAPRVLVGLRDGERGPIFCFHPAGGDVLAYRSLLECLDFGWSVRGVQSRALADASLECANLEEMVSSYAHAIEAAQPQGNLFLLGWSLGGVIALEVAKVLEGRGRSIAFLGLLDSHVIDPDRGAPNAFVRVASGLGSLAARFASLGPAELEKVGERIARVPAPGRFEAAVAIAREMGVVDGDARILRDERSAALHTLHSSFFKGYVPSRVRAAIFSCLAQESAAHASRSAPWKDATPNLVEFEAPGNHYSLLQPPNVQAVADRLGRALNDAWRKSGAP